MMVVFINFKNFEGKNKVFILGDMFEFGSEVFFEY